MITLIIKQISEDNSDPRPEFFSAPMKSKKLYFDLFAETDLLTYLGKGSNAENITFLKQILVNVE